MSILRTPPTVYLSGDNLRLIGSVAVCLIAGGSDVIIRGNDNKYIADYIDRVFKTHRALHYHNYLKPGTMVDDSRKADIAILLTSENLEVKRDGIRELEKLVDSKCPVVCNIESILLSELQSIAVNPERIIGVHCKGWL
jgi:3-hydroxyacyl-CoA dehydrogenase